MKKRSFNRSFLKGMSNVLVFGKKPKNRNINTYSDALTHDLGNFKKDFFNALSNSIKDLPVEKKIELKHKLLEGDE
jgi:hypothetical protein